MGTVFPSILLSQRWLESVVSCRDNSVNQSSHGGLCAFSVVHTGPDAHSNGQDGRDEVPAHDANWVLVLCAVVVLEQSSGSC